MATNLQNEANRQNAKRSTGPKTPAGKARSSQNALRHGLTTRQRANDHNFAGLTSPLVCILSRGVAPDIATMIAGARHDLMRVAEARLKLLMSLQGSPGPVSARRLRALDRYERAALAQQKRALRLLGR